MVSRLPLSADDDDAAPVPVANENGFIPVAVELEPKEKPVAPLLAATPPNTDGPVVVDDVFEAPNENNDVPLEVELLLPVLTAELLKV